MVTRLNNSQGVTAELILWQGRWYSPAARFNFKYAQKIRYGRKTG